MAMDLLVEARGLVKEYGAGARVVDDVSFEIRRGETMGLVGESGSGKSTVARMLLRLVEPTAGEVRYGGVDLLAASSGEMREMRRTNADCVSGSLCSTESEDASEGDSGGAVCDSWRSAKGRCVCAIAGDAADGGDG